MPHDLTRLSIRLIVVTIEIIIPGIPMQPRR